MRSFFSTLLSLAWLPALAAPPPVSEFTFDVLHNGLAIAEVVEKFEHDGRTYRAEEIWRGRGALMVLGQIRRASRGLVTASGLRPQEFTDERSGRPTASAIFDYTGRTLTLKYRGEPQVLPLPPHAHDRLAFAYQFAFAGHGRPITFDVADGRSVSTQVYEPAGRERIRVPAGEFDTVRMARRAEGPGDRVVELWLAAAHGYLPVRIRIVEKDGTRTEQVATRIGPP